MAKQAMESMQEAVEPLPAGVAATDGPPAVVNGVDGR